MKNIHHEAKKLYRQLKGDLTIPNLIRFIESKGYNVVFFNTDEGDDLIRRYNIDRKEVPSFMYTGITKVVFVDDSLHINDKAYCLLHECGHLLLKHAKENEIHSIDKRSTECEADAFAYSVMNYSPLKTLRNTLFTLSFAILIIAGTALCTRSYVLSTQETYVPSEVSKATNTQHITTNVPVNETVYITPSGTKYHRASCRYAKSSTALEVQRSKAEKTYSPCSVCNP